MDKVTDEVNQKVLKLIHTLPSHTEWKKIRSGTRYHVPRIYTQPPMDILVLSKSRNFITCEITMEGVTYACHRIHRDSLSAILMVKERKF